MNYCARLQFAGGRPDRIIKIANRDPAAVEVERRLYPEMLAAGLPVPEIEYSHEDWSEEAPPFIIMPKFSDETLVEVCQRFDGQTVQTLRRAGSFIGEVDRQFAAEFDRFRSMSTVRQRLAETQERIDQPDDLELIQANAPELSETIEAQLMSLSVPTQAKLTHGQPHTRNILSDRQGRICVIDFGETIGYRSPLSDLYLLLTSHDGWSRGTGDPMQRQAILEGYGALDQGSWTELKYWEFRSWTRELQSYIRFSKDPETDAEFVAGQLQFIKSRILEIPRGGGLISRIHAEMMGEE